MSNLPPPLPNRPPPKLPPARKEAEALLFAIKAWFSGAILTGLAAGRAEAVWRSIKDKDPGSEIGFVGLFLAGGGVAGLSYCLCYLASRPSVKVFLGMKRAFWLMGMPLAWLFGLGIGFFWRYL